MARVHCSMTQPSYPPGNLGVDAPPEPFTETQQRQSRLDGGVEEDGHVRGLAPVTGAPLWGHLVREGIAVASALRPLVMPTKRSH